MTFVEQVCFENAILICWRKLCGTVSNLRVKAPRIHLSMDAVTTSNKLGPRMLGFMLVNLRFHVPIYLAAVV